jgi:RNA polymerase sigma-70 factor, ECF subfamily
MKYLESRKIIKKNGILKNHANVNRVNRLSVDSTDRFCTKFKNRERVATYSNLAFVSLPLNWQLNFHVHPPTNLIFLAHSATPVSDERIVQLLRQGDAQGVSLMYDKYSGALFAAVLRIVGASEIAEEVLQDTFTKAWRNVESYDTSKGRLFTWLINIARNTAIDATRRKNFKQKNQALDNVVNEIDITQNTALNPDTLDLKRLTAQLPSEYKSLVDLVYFQGFTQAEAAEALDVPLGTVKTRMRTAMVKLRAMFSWLFILFLFN